MKHVSSDETVSSDVEFEAEVSIRGWNDHGRVSGPPEDCYPPDSEHEYDLLSITIFDTLLKRDMTPEAAVKAINRIINQAYDSIAEVVRERFEELIDE